MTEARGFATTDTETIILDTRVHGRRDSCKYLVPLENWSRRTAALGQKKGGVGLDLVLNELRRLRRPCHRGTDVLTRIFKACSSPARTSLT